MDDRRPQPPDPVTGAIAEAYDAVPYGMRTHARTHPRRLQTAGTLWGMRPAPADGCRVLELGCGEGANLLVLAEALPQSQFVGVDLSHRQVRMGRDRVDELGLGNVDLRQGDLRELDDTLGEFDYVLVAGVFSWVPAAIRERLLALCRTVLAPHGIAYVSYNTTPGWYVNGALRTLLLDHTRSVDGWDAKIRAGRALLTGLATTLDERAPYQALLLEHVRQASARSDEYLAHEYLAPVNEPMSVAEFVGRAESADLRHIADANIADGGAEDLDAQVRNDLLVGTTFRAALLCRSDVALRAAPDPAAVIDLHAVAAVRPREAPVVDDASTAEFVDRSGGTIATRAPAMKAVLLELADRWPRSAPVRSVVEVARHRVGASAAHADLEREICEQLLGLHHSHAVELTVQPYPVADRLGDRPQVRATARLEATVGNEVTNQLHEQHALDDLLCFLVRALDGTRTVDDLIDLAVGAVARGDVVLADPDGSPVDDPARQRALVAELVPRALGVLVEGAMIAPGTPPATADVTPA